MDVTSYILGKKSSSGGGSNLKYVVVDELPTTGEDNTIYLVPKSTSKTNNYYDEYMYINSEWEKIGDTEVDLSTKQDVMQFATMPTASSSNEGKIIQYTGTTGNDYTNGHFYKCVSDGQNPATYSWTEASVQDISNKQDTLVSGTNIKTINSESILGSGDITISGGALGDCIVYQPSAFNATTTTVTNFNDNQRNQILTILNECYQKGKVPVIIIGNWNFPIYLVGSGLVRPDRFSTDGGYTFKGAFTVGDNSNSTSSTNKNKFGLARMICKVTLNNGVIVRDGFLAWYLYINHEQYLPTDNEYSYTPTSQYHPATKGYVDSAVSGEVITDSGATYTITNLTGNKAYKLGTLTSLTINATTTFDTETVIYFASGNTPTDITIPYSITNLGDAPTLTTSGTSVIGTCETEKSYIISVLNNIAVWKCY